MHLILFLVALACQRSAANPSKDDEKYDGGGQQLKNRPEDVHRSKRSSENFAALGAVYPVQVDLTDWIVRSEKRMENLTALVESHFRGIVTLIEGFQKKFEDLDDRIHSLEERTQRNYDKLEYSFEQLKENCSASAPPSGGPTVETATGKTTDSSIVTDQSRAPFAPTSASTFSTSITPALSTTEWTCKIDPCAVTSPWILIMTRDYTVSYKEAFKDATRRDYRDGFGSALTSTFWRGLQEVHELTSKGRWTLKIQFRYPGSWYYDKDVDSPRSRKYGEVEWDNFSVGPAEKDYPLGLGEQISATNFKGDPFIQEKSREILNQRGAVFSTPDDDIADCAKRRKGGWWFLRGRCYPDICLTCDTYRGVLRTRVDNGGLRQTSAVESFMWIKKET